MSDDFKCVQYQYRVLLDLKDGGWHCWHDKPKETLEEALKSAEFAKQYLKSADKNEKYGFGVKIERRAIGEWECFY